MSAIPRHLRRLAIGRARSRCEYCQLAQAGQVATFHIDHIVPLASGGRTEAANLALSCVNCSLRKGARQTALDPMTGVVVALFHPRLERWRSHFRWRGNVLRGISATGRATIAALHLNHPRLVQIRGEERHHGRHPPPARE
jgi:hypothetical protein